MSPARARLAPTLAKTRWLPPKRKPCLSHCGSFELFLLASPKKMIIAMERERARFVSTRSNTYSVWVGTRLPTDTPPKPKTNEVRTSDKSSFGGLGEHHHPSSSIPISQGIFFKESRISSPFTHDIGLPSNPPENHESMLMQQPR